MQKIIKFPVRLLVFMIGYFVYVMEAGADWVIGTKSKTEYIRQGKCNRCGRCCRLLALEVPRIFLKWKFLTRLLIAYHSLCLNFQSEGIDGNWLVYRCGYYQEDEGAGRCRIYHFRHRLCRFYPTQRLYGHPKLHRECGFKFVRRDGKPSFDDILAEKETQFNQHDGSCH